MKKIITTAMVLSSMMAFAQEDGRVGINTDKPTATLGVKSQALNGATGTGADTKNLELLNAADTKLVTVLDNGNVGINNEAPTQKLDIAGKVKIVDGTQGVGKVLTSDANGVASWQNSALNLVFGERTGATPTYNKSDDGKWIDGQMQITLPPGNWLVKVTLIMDTHNKDIANGIWLQTSLADYNDPAAFQTAIANNNFLTSLTKDFRPGYSALVSGGQSVGHHFSVVTGEVIIDNKSGADKTYRLIGRATLSSGAASDAPVRFGGDGYSENMIYAIKIQ